MFLLPNSVFTAKHFDDGKAFKVTFGHLYLYLHGNSIMFTSGLKFDTKILTICQYFGRFLAIFLLHMSRNTRRPPWTDLHKIWHKGCLVDLIICAKFLAIVRGLDSNFAPLV